MAIERTRTQGEASIGETVEYGGSWWGDLRFVWKLLIYTRVSGLIVLVGAAILFLNDQGRDTLAGLSALSTYSWREIGKLAFELESPLWRGLLYLLGVSFWAFQSWGWARHILDQEYPRDDAVTRSGVPDTWLNRKLHAAFAWLDKVLDKLFPTNAPTSDPFDNYKVLPPNLQFWVRNVPRFIGMGAFGVALASMVLARAPLEWTVLLVVMACIVFSYFRMRREMAAEYIKGESAAGETELKRTAKWIALLSAVAIAVVCIVGLLVTKDTAGLKLGLVLLVLGLIITWVLFKLRVLYWGAALSKTQMQTFSWIVIIITTVSALIEPVGFGNIVGAGGAVFFGLGCIVPVASLLASVLYRHKIPMVTGLVLLALAFSFWNDNHQIRTVEDEQRQSVSLTETFTSWHALTPTTERKPIVLVAAAGGGLRAAYYTSTVLAALEDRLPGFHEHVFAISGVSGGSLGGLAYSNALTSTFPCDENDTEGRGCLQQAVNIAMGRDYLGPTAAGLLYADLMQRFFPFPWFRSRATVLETAWEVGYADTFPEQSDCTFATAFHKLWDKDCLSRQGSDPLKWRPLLLLNGTYEETGQRVITSHIEIESQIFLDSHDFFRLNDDRAIPGSTAAHNSARFAYVSPAGTFGSKGQGHIIDGGYFENFGAESIRDVLHWLRKRDEARYLSPIVLVISNDYALPRRALESYPPMTVDGVRFLNEARAPLKGMLTTRQARGLFAVKALREEVKDFCRGDPQCTPQVILVHLEPEESRDMTVGRDREPPLGWVLSPEAQRYMLDDLKYGQNQAALDKMVELLTP